MTRIILGIDPGIAKIGWGVIEANGTVRCVDYGYFETHKERRTNMDDISARCHYIAGRIGELVERFRPDEIAIEAFVLHAQNPRLGTVGVNIHKVIGALAEVARSHGIPDMEHRRKDVLQGVTRDREASKAMVARYVRLHLGMKEPPRPEHAADALAVALYHTGKSWQHRRPFVRKSKWRLL